VNSADSAIVLHFEEVLMNRQTRVLFPMLVLLATLGMATGSASAAVTITGTVGASGKFLVTGMPVSATAPAVLKITFENRSSGTNLALCAGTPADFTAGTCPMSLSGSGGPGFRFLTIVDAAKLSDKIIYVKRAVGSAASAFVLTVE
jgi:hypothetical protein